MNTASITEFKKFTTAEIKSRLPLEITADGSVIAVVDTTGKSMVGTLTKCPNCKLEFTVKPTDGKPYFFTSKHPKGG